MKRLHAAAQHVTHSSERRTNIFDSCAALSPPRILARASAAAVPAPALVCTRHVLVTAFAQRTKQWRAVAAASRVEPAGPASRAALHARAAWPAGAAGRRCEASPGASAAQCLNAAPAQRCSRRRARSGTAGCCSRCLLRRVRAGGSSAPRHVGSARRSACRRRVRGLARHRVRHAVLWQAAAGRLALQRAHPALGQAHLRCETHALRRALRMRRSRRLGPAPLRRIPCSRTHLIVIYCAALRCAAAAASDARHCAASLP